MVRLNRKIEYALIALKYMSSKYAGQLTTAKEICSATGVPFDATSRVMQQMVRKNILKAELGAGGGYQLVRDLSKISFLEIIELITGKVEVVRCVAGMQECEISLNCNVATPLRVFNERLATFYRELTIAELLGPIDRKVKLKTEPTLEAKSELRDMP